VDEQYLYSILKTIEICAQMCQICFLDLCNDMHRSKKKQTNFCYTCCPSPDYKLSIAATCFFINSTLKVYALSQMYKIRWDMPAHDSV